MVGYFTSTVESSCTRSSLTRTPVRGQREGGGGRRRRCCHDARAGRIVSAHNHFPALPSVAGIDTDKFDYLARDTHNVGLASSFDYRRIVYR